MTEREKMLRDAYIPSPRDPDLESNAYYILDPYDKIQKVFIREINPDLKNDRTVYGVRYWATGKRYGGEEYGKTQMSELYDNKEDCRNQTHMCYDYWEYLRGLK